MCAPDRDSSNEMRNEGEKERRTDTCTYRSIHTAHYLVKSCGAFDVPAGVAWPVGDRGLLYDRTFMIVAEADGMVRLCVT